MNLSEIQDLIKFVAKSGVTEVEISQKDFKITIKSENESKKGGRGKQQQLEYVAQQMPMQMQQLPQQQQQAQQNQNSVSQDQSGSAAAAASPKKEESNKYVTVKSPMIGTFYRSPGPDKDEFVNVGDDIKPGKVICIIEAMKLFNEIEAEVSGKIVKMLVDDATPVEYDQPLFLIDPA